jgi:hypothetical protein
MPPVSHSLRVRFSRVAAIGVAACLLAVAPGCNTMKKRPTAVAAPADGWTTPAAIDIENFNGSVTVIVDPTVTEVKPTVKTRASVWIVDAVRKQAIDSIKVTTRTIDQEGRAVYVLRTSTSWNNPKEVWVNLTIRMPRCDGVRVFNRGGDVRLSGVTGAIQVDNGEYADRTGGIEVRTDADMSDPVALITNSGNVVYQVGGGSVGEYTLDAEGGDEMFDSNNIAPGMVHTNGSVTTASIGEGSNAVLLKTGKGSATVIYMNDPMKYTRRKP